MKIIINADDFGMSKTVNQAIAEGVKNGILTSTCIMVNMPAFEDAVRKFKDFPNTGLGVHLNIIEYKSVQKIKEKNSNLYDSEGKFNNGFLQLLLKSSDEDFLFEVEQEFRTQIEMVLENLKPDHLDSHVHVHAIPKIFELVCKLAKEYNIPCVRTQFEHLHVAEKHYKDFFNPKYYINLIKICLLNFFTVINRRTLKKYGLKSNDCVIGVGYTSMMDEHTIKSGIDYVKKHKDKEVLEVICHPDLSEKRKSNYKEYQSITSENLKKYVQNFERISYKNL